MTIDKELYVKIRACIEKWGDPILRHFIEDCQPFTQQQITDALNAMVSFNIVRMKEDIIDHDWSYRQGRNWNI